jgi:hypothetical protein
MSERSNKCRKLFKAAIVLYDNLGPNEQSELDTFLDELEEKRHEFGFLVDNATSCTCGSSDGIVSFNEKKYCLDCFHYMSENAY